MSDDEKLYKAAARWRAVAWTMLTVGIVGGLIVMWETGPAGCVGLLCQDWGGAIEAGLIVFGASAVPALPLFGIANSLDAHADTRRALHLIVNLITGVAPGGPPTIDTHQAAVTRAQWAAWQAERDRMT